MESTVLGLTDLISVLRRRWVTVSLITMLVLGAMLGLSFRETPIYSSSAEVLVLPVQDPATATRTSFVLMTNELRIAQSQAVAEIAVEANPQASAGVAVTSPDNTETLVFSSSSPDPVVARDTAQAFAEAYLTFRHDSLLSAVEMTGESLRTIITGLNSEVAELQEEFAATNDPDQRAALQLLISSKVTEVSQHQARLNDLELASNVSVGRILQPAYQPTAPSSPDHRKAGLLGGVVGIMLGVGLAFLRERLHPSLRTHEDLESAAGAPLIAITPRSRLLARNPSFRATNDPRLAHGFRALRTVVQFTASKRDIRSIMITSAQEGEGKTTTAANLAISLAESGKRVRLILADMWKRPRGDHFGVHDQMGLAQVLGDHLPVAEVLVSTDVDGLMVLPSGSTDAAHRPEYGTDEIEEIVRELSVDADVVLLDVPPVLAVSDALEIAPAVDGVLLVADVKHVGRSDLADAAKQLWSVGARIMGVVASKVVPGPLHRFPHGYGSTYGDQDGSARTSTTIERRRRRVAGEPAASPKALHGD